jgi:hypothetical protein
MGSNLHTVLLFARRKTEGPIIGPWSPSCEFGVQPTHPRRPMLRTNYGVLK